MAVVRANAKYGNRLLRKIDKLNLGLSVGTPGAHAITRSLYIQNIVFAYMCNSHRITACCRKKKQRRDYTCLLRDAVMSALVMRPFVTDPYRRRDYICVYAYENICIFYDSEPLYRSLHVVSCDSKNVGKFYRFLNMNIYIGRSKKDL